MILKKTQPPCQQRKPPLHTLHVAVAPRNPRRRMKSRSWQRTSSNLPWSHVCFSFSYKFPMTWNTAIDCTKEIIYLDFQSVNLPPNFLRMAKVLPGGTRFGLLMDLRGGSTRRVISRPNLGTISTIMMLVPSLVMLLSFSLFEGWPQVVIVSKLGTCKLVIFLSSALRVTMLPSGAIGTLMGWMMW